MANWHGFQGKEGQKIPNMPEEFVNEVSKRYIELYEKISGMKFKKADQQYVEARIEINVVEALKKLN